VPIDLTLPAVGSANWGPVVNQALTDLQNFANDLEGQGYAVAPGSANNPHTTADAARNDDLPKNFWQYPGTVGEDEPLNALDGDEWINK
jgi:hypothetical protein